jgi:hypothetical protein
MTNRRSSARRKRPNFGVKLSAGGVSGQAAELPTSLPAARRPQIATRYFGTSFAAAARLYFLSREPAAAYTKDVTRPNPHAVPAVSVRVRTTVGSGCIVVS